MVWPMQTATGAHTDAGDLLMAGLFSRLQAEIEAPGLSPIDLLDMPAAQATVINKIIRNNGMKLEDIVRELDQSPAEIQKTLNKLIEKGYARPVQVKEEIWYKAKFARKADKVLSLSIWSSLDDVVEDEENQ